MMVQVNHMQLFSSPQCRCLPIGDYKWHTIIVIAYVYTCGINWHVLKNDDFKGVDMKYKL